jgi:hypothetical protein
MISFEKCKKVLAAIWLIGFLIPFIILSLQTIQGSFWGGKESEAWALFTPMILPTIGLIIGVLVADALNPVVEDKKVNSTIFYVTLALSLLYLGLVITIFVLLPTMAAPDFTTAGSDATVKDAAKCELWEKKRLVATLEHGRESYGDSARRLSKSECLEAVGSSG